VSHCKDDAPTTTRVQYQQCRQFVQVFHGNLTAEQTFGKDPLNELPAKRRAREAEFKKHFPRFDLIFQAIANGNYALLRDAILYFINLTKYLSRQ